MSDFDNSSNKWTDKIPSYINSYTQLYTFTKYLTNYILTGVTALNNICINSNINKAHGNLLQLLAQKINVIVPPDLQNKGDAVTKLVINNGILNRVTTGTAIDIKSSILRIYPSIGKEGVKIVDKGVLSNPTSMTYAISIAADLGIDDLSIINKYILGDILGVARELNLIQGNLFSFDREINNYPQTPKYGGWDKANWTHILI